MNPSGVSSIRATQKLTGAVILEKHRCHHRCGEEGKRLWPLSRLSLWFPAGIPVVKPLRLLAGEGTWEAVCWGSQGQNRAEKDGSRGGSYHLCHNYSFCHCRVKASIDSKEMNVYSCVSLKLYLQNSGPNLQLQFTDPWP